MVTTMHDEARNIPHHHAFRQRKRKVLICFSMGFHADAKFGFFIFQRYPQTHLLIWLHALITDFWGKTLLWSMRQALFFAYLQFEISLVHKNPRTNSRIFVLKMPLDFLARSTFSADIFHLLPYMSCNWTRNSLHEHDQFPCPLLL
jgi:hypothetical protein